MDGHDRVLLALNSNGARASVGIKHSRIAHSEYIKRTAVAYASGISLNLSLSLLRDNRAQGTGSGCLTLSLLQLLGGGRHFMRQSAVVTNPVLQMALLDGTSLNIAGSSADGSTMRVIPAAIRGSLSHRGCLLTHPRQSDASLLEETAPGVFSEGTAQNDPALSPRFIPTPAPRALDGCSTARGGGGLDFYNQPRNIELLGVINFPFPNLEPGT